MVTGVSFQCTLTSLSRIPNFFKFAKFFYKRVTSWNLLYFTLVHCKIYFKIYLFINLYSIRCELFPLPEDLHTCAYVTKFFCISCMSRMASLYVTFTLMSWVSLCICKPLITCYTYIHVYRYVCNMCIYVPVHHCLHTCIHVCIYKHTIHIILYQLS